MKSTARGHKNCSKMSTINFTGERPQKTFEELFCAAKFTQGIQSQLIVFSAVNMFLSIIAFLGNSLILVALHKETSLHPPSKLLYRNLAITNVCVGIIAQPLLVIWCMLVINERWNSCVYALYGALTTGLTLCAVSLLTMTAVSVDRLLALLLGLRYMQVRGNFTANLSDHTSFLGSVFGRRFDAFSELRYHLLVQLYNHSPWFNGIKCLSRDDFHNFASTPDSSARRGSP